MDFLSRICILSLLSAISLQLISNVQANPITFNVLNYGAIGDAKTDDSGAFQKAWKATCTATNGAPVMVIPKGKTFLLHPTTFSGPCKSIVNVSLSGMLKAPVDFDAWKDPKSHKYKRSWLEFHGVKGLNIYGNGMLDGSGQMWWDNSCKRHAGKGCSNGAPTAFGVWMCSNVSMANIYVVQSPQMHVVVYQSESVFFTNLIIRSPKTSPNTDGIHISHSKNVWVHGSVIQSGDDCVSIGEQTSNIHVMYSKCGPGHGISIGSLGKSGHPVQVEYITVKHIDFYETTNGARIKTWQAGSGHLQNVEFSFLNFTRVQNPIIIDQHYCDQPQVCKATKTGVKISGVSFYQAYGSSTTQAAINLNCSNSVPCTDISLQEVHLYSESKSQVWSSCNNAFGIAKGTVIPNSCLK